MNLPNCIALCFFVAALTSFLMGIFFPLTVPLKSPAELIEQTRPILGTHPLEDRALPMMRRFPWLIPTVIFFGASCLALAFAAAGFSIWFFVGRRRVLELEHGAAQQKSREETLQNLIGAHVESWLGHRATRRELDVAELTSGFQALDPERQRRFEILRQECKGAPSTDATRVSRSSALLFQSKKILARALALVLGLIGLFMCLWAMLPLLFADLIASFYKEALGLELDSNDAILAMLFIWILAVIPFGISFGLLWLSRLESRLEKAWQQGLEDARDFLLSAYRGQLERFPARTAETAVDRLPILRGLTRTTLPELDAAGKRSALELLRDQGWICKDGPCVDLNAIDCRGADLRQIVLSDTCLRGLDLQRADLAEAELARSDLSTARLTGAGLRDSNLQGACLYEADLRSARLHRANLSQADLRRAQLTDANLWQARLHGVDLSETRVDAAQLAAADR